jgi:hypothetical protein
MDPSLGIMALKHGSMRCATRHMILPRRSRLRLVKFDRQLVTAFGLAVACGIAPKPEVALPSAIIDHLVPASTIAASDVQSLPQVVDATYRLRPDRRILLAVCDILELTAGRHEPVEIDFRAGRWIVRCDKREVGQLPDLPTFADGMSLLTKWAAAVRSAANQVVPHDTLASIDRDLDELTAASLFRAASRVVQARGTPDLPGMTRIARALTLLNLMAEEDHFGLADPLRARALAVIAMARASDPATLPEEQAAMARLMRYDKEASDAAAMLPSSSFARVWITGVGEPAPQNTLADYVTAAVNVRMSHGPPKAEELATWRARLGNRLAPLLLEKLHFETQQDVARRVSALLATDQETSELSPTEVLDRFESTLPRRAAAMASAVADRSVVESYYQSVFYSALDAEFNFHFDGMASADSTSQYFRSLKTRSPTGRQVVEWMSSMHEARYGKNATASLRSIEHLRDMGGSKRAVLLRETADRIGTNEPAVRLATDTLFPQLDSRPECLARAADLASTIIGDPLHRDRYMEAVIDRAPLVTEYGTLAWYYRTMRDTDRLRALVDAPDARPGDRARALGYLHELGRVDDKFVDSRFDQLLLEGRFGGVYSIYTEILNRRRDGRRKEQVARRALAANPEGTAISAAYYASSLANALERQGRYEEAWTVVEPHIPAWNEDIISEAVVLLQRRGHEADANELGRQLVERYPSSGRFDFAPVRWREHRYADAARLFDPKEVAISQADWDRWMPDAFEETFESDTASAVAAFRPLIATNLDPTLLEAVPRELLRRGMPNLAFALAEQLVELHRPVTPDPYAASHLILAYRALKAAKGEAPAIEWLRQRLPAKALLQTIVIAYEEGEFPLVAALRNPVPDPSEQIQIDGCYAGALLSMHVPRDDPRWAQLIADVRSENPQVNTLVDTTRYLLGLSDLKTVAASRETRSTIEYFIGLKAAADGDYDRALPFVLAAARGSYNEPPPAWAATLLSRWAHAGKWAEVKVQRIL